MNRQEALEWLVQNVTKWPTNVTMAHSGQQYDFWRTIAGGVVFCVYDDIDCPEARITQQQWLDATDNMPHSDCESVFE